MKDHASTQDHFVDHRCDCRRIQPPAGRIVGLDQRSFRASAFLVRLDFAPQVLGTLALPSDFLITYRVPWKGTVPQRVRNPPGKLSLQPVAIGADDGGNDIVRSTSVERVA